MTHPFDRDWDRMRSPEARAARTEGPWFHQGPLVHGPDKGGVDIGPLIAECGNEADAAYIVGLVNREWRRLSVNEGGVAPVARTEAEPHE